MSIYIKNSLFHFWLSLSTVTNSQAAKWSFMAKFSAKRWRHDWKEREHETHQISNDNSHDKVDQDEGPNEDKDDEVGSREGEIGVS